MRATFLYQAFVAAGVCTPTHIKASGLFMDFRTFIGTGQRSTAGVILHMMHAPTKAKRR